MSTSRSARTQLEDANVNVKIKLSGLWVSLMFFYMYRMFWDSWSQGMWMIC